MYDVELCKLYVSGSKSQFTALATNTLPQGVAQPSSDQLACLLVISLASVRSRSTDGRNYPMAINLNGDDTSLRLANLQ